MMTVHWQTGNELLFEKKKAQSKISEKKNLKSRSWNSIVIFPLVHSNLIFHLADTDSRHSKIHTQICTHARTHIEQVQEHRWTSPILVCNYDIGLNFQIRQALLMHMCLYLSVYDCERCAWELVKNADWIWVIVHCHSTAFILSLWMRLYQHARTYTSIVNNSAATSYTVTESPNNMLFNWQSHIIVISMSVLHI